MLWICCKLQQTFALPKTRIFPNNLQCNVALCDSWCNLWLVWTRTLRSVHTCDNLQRKCNGLLCFVSDWMSGSTGSDRCLDIYQFTASKQNQIILYQQLSSRDKTFCLGWVCRHAPSREPVPVQLALSKKAFDELWKFDSMIKTLFCKLWLQYLLITTI